jgi:hypothetical protein
VIDPINSRIIVRLSATLLQDITELASAFGVSRNRAINICLSTSFLTSLLAAEKARAKQAEKRKRAIAAHKESRGRALLRLARKRLDARKAARVKRDE